MPLWLSTVFLLPFLCIGITTPSIQDRGKCPLLKIIINKKTSLSVIVSQVFTKKSFMSRSGPALLPDFYSLIAFMTSACVITSFSSWNESFNKPSSCVRIRSYISSSATYDTSLGFPRSLKYSKKSVHVNSEEVGDLFFLINFHISLEFWFWAFTRRSVLSLLWLKRHLLAHLVYLSRTWTISLLDSSVLVFLYSFRHSIKSCFNCLHSGVIQGIFPLVGETLGFTLMWRLNNGSAQPCITLVKDTTSSSIQSLSAVWSTDDNSDVTLAVCL